MNANNEYAIFIEDYTKSKYPCLPKKEVRSYYSYKGFKMGIKALAKRGFEFKEIMSFAKYDCRINPKDCEIIGIHYYVTLIKVVD